MYAIQKICHLILLLYHNKTILWLFFSILSWKHIPSMGKWLSARHPWARTASISRTHFGASSYWWKLFLIVLYSFSMPSLYVRYVNLSDSENALQITGNAKSRMNIPIIAMAPQHYQPLQNMEKGGKARRFWKIIPLTKQMYAFCHQQTWRIIQGWTALRQHQARYIKLAPSIHFLTHLSLMYHSTVEPSTWILLLDG